MDQLPAWVPGSPRLVIVSERTEGRRLWVLDRTDREPARQLATGTQGVDAPAVSPDGRWVAFTQVGQGVFVVPLDGSSPPRRLTSGDDDGSACFSRDGATVYFQTRAPDGRPRIDAIPFEGGTPRPVREGAAGPTTTPGADVLAFLAVEGTAGEGVATLLDLRTGRTRPFSPRLGPARRIRLSPDGRRAVVLQGSMGAVEVDVARGTVLTRYDAGSDQISGFAYMGDEIVVSHRAVGGESVDCGRPVPGMREAGISSGRPSPRRPTRRGWPARASAPAAPDPFRPGCARAPRPAPPCREPGAR